MLSKPTKKHKIHISYFERMIVLPNNKIKLDSAVKDAEKFLKRSKNKNLSLPKSTSNTVTRASNFVANNHTIQNIVAKQLGVKK
jgi:hypothetical protein